MNPEQETAVVGANCRYQGLDSSCAEWIIDFVKPIDEQR